MKKKEKEQHLNPLQLCMDHKFLSLTWSILLQLYQMLDDITAVLL